MHNHVGEGDLYSLSTVSSDNFFHRHPLTHAPRTGLISAVWASLSLGQVTHRINHEKHLRFPGYLHFVALLVLVL